MNYNTNISLILAKYKILQGFKYYWRQLVEAKKSGKEWDMDYYYHHLDVYIDMLTIIYPNIKTWELAQIARNYRYRKEFIKL